ncbi:unannotated protein [freshwater metagenome]|uniref:Unannotated protein n=1 Tax=freshwater metagenome TaxID=449393 RepID=A0A6J7XW22_9ZZZZ|nr:redoxin domain-containing protein [Actinomycetota bacterium]
MKRISIICVLLLSACSTHAQPVARGIVSSCSTIKQSPAAKGIELACLDGKSNINLDSIKGPLVLNIWGSWCAPCEDEIPLFVDFYAQNKTAIALLGIAVEEAKPSDATSFIISHAMTWPNLIDTDGRTTGKFGMGVPVTWFIAADGTVAYKHIGVLKSVKEIQSLTSKYLGITS